MGNIILYTFFVVSITLGFPSRRMLEINENKKQNEMRAVNCLTNQGSNCGPILKTLWKNVELENVVQNILKTTFEDKTQIAKIILKSYFKKSRKTQQKNKEMKIKLNHIFKII
jgi:hypothetical protein